MARDYYGLLGVSKGANDSEIKRAYRKLARELHPDVNPDEAAQAQFKEVTAAYEVLSDPEKRRIVDLGGDPLEGAGAGNGFGGGFGGAGFGGNDTVVIGAASTLGLAGCSQGDGGREVGGVAPVAAGVTVTTPAPGATTASRGVGPSATTSAGPTTAPAPSTAPMIAVEADRISDPFRAVIAASLVRASRLPRVGRPSSSWNAPVTTVRVGTTRKTRTKRRNGTSGRMLP